MVYQLLNSNGPSHTIDEMEQKLVDGLYQAANSAIRYTKPPKQNYKVHWYYDTRVKEYNHRVNQARKLSRRHKTQATRDLLRAAIRTAQEGKRK